jgi:hypothetical protein
MFFALVAHGRPTPVLSSTPLPPNYVQKDGFWANPPENNCPAVRQVC